MHFLLSPNLASTPALQNNKLSNRFIRKIFAVYFHLLLALRVLLLYRWSLISAFFIGVFTKFVLLQMLPHGVVYLKFD